MNHRRERENGLLRTSGLQRTTAEMWTFVHIPVSRPASSEGEVDTSNVTMCAETCRCLGDDGRPNFAGLLFRPGSPWFLVCDVLRL